MIKKYYKIASIIRGEKYITIKLKGSSLKITNQHTRY